MAIFPRTGDRVPLHTADEVNRRLKEKARRNVLKYAAAGPAAIDARIARLQREWDIERTLEANAATLALVGLGLGIAVDRRFLALPVLVGGFLLQHALQGWCPPLPVLRRLGVRTAGEIHEEITALRVLRGDFIRTDDPMWALHQAEIRIH